MAAKYSEEIAIVEPETLDTVELSIRKTFNYLMQKLVERRDLLIVQIEEIREDYLYQEEKRIENLKSLDERIRRKQKENAERHSKRNERLIEDWRAQREQYNQANPIPSPLHFDKSHLEELRYQIEMFGVLEDATQIYSSKLGPIWSIGKEGKGPVELNRPYGVAPDGKGNVFIADSGNKRIQLFSLEGQFIREFGEGELTDPTAIALFREWLFVTDCGKNRIMKYKINYELECTSDLKLSEPSGIAVDSDEVFVADCRSNIVVVLNLDLKLIREIGDKKLLRPQDVKVNNNKLFVTDNSKPHNVHVFSKLGDLLHSIISLRNGNNWISLCFDKFNNILISDYYDKIIQIYTLEGRLIHSIECDYKPTGITVTQDNIIVCIDTKSHKINFY